MNHPACFQPHANGVYIAVKVQPRAARNEVSGLVGLELKVRVTAPPVDAAANEALLRLLAETLGCPRGAVQLVRGHTARRKVVFAQGVSLETAAARLLPGQ
jgi:hypothetical protein